MSPPPQEWPLSGLELRHKTSSGSFTQMSVFAEAVSIFFLFLKLDVLGGFVQVPGEKMVLNPLSV